MEKVFGGLSTVASIPFFGLVSVADLLVQWQQLPPKISPINSKYLVQLFSPTMQPNVWVMGDKSWKTFLVAADWFVWRRAPEQSRLPADFSDSRKKL